MIHESLSNFIKIIEPAGSEHIGLSFQEIAVEVSKSVGDITNLSRNDFVDIEDEMVSHIHHLEMLVEIAKEARKEFRKAWRSGKPLLGRPPTPTYNPSTQEQSSIQQFRKTIGLMTVPTAIKHFFIKTENSSAHWSKIAYWTGKTPNTVKKELHQRTMFISDGNGNYMLHPQEYRSDRHTTG